MRSTIIDKTADAARLTWWHLLAAAAKARALTLTLRSRAVAAAADARGIALQTVIVMVVLIAIAGGVATVLLQTGRDATDNLKGTTIGPRPEAYTSQVLCEAAGLKWTTSAIASSTNTDPAAPAADSCYKTI